MNSIPPRTPGDMNLANQGFIQIAPGVWERPKPGQVVAIPAQEFAPVDLEGKLHDQIIKWCDEQWPKVKFIHARMDQKSTIQVGCQDFTIFMPGGRTVSVECKAKGKKLDPDQLIWHKEMSMLGHHVLTVWSFEEFLILIKPKQKK